MTLSKVSHFATWLLGLVSHFATWGVRILQHRGVAFCNVFWGWCRILQRFSWTDVAFCNVERLRRCILQHLNGSRFWFGPAKLGQPSPRRALPFTVSKKDNWDIKGFVKVPIQLVMCDELQANSRLLLIMLMNQVGFKPVSIGVIDRCLGIHRSTRIRCLAELRELGFIAGTDSHFVLNDPVPILKALRDKKNKALKEADELLDAFSIDTQQELASEVESSEKRSRDYMQEATDAWNRYRPKDYHKIRRISAPLVKALDIHMRELGIKAHHYEEFFSILKTGIERSEFWSKNNSNKTLQSITGIGSPTDKKKLNVYSLFNDGVDCPAASVEEVERNDTITFPAEYRPLIDEYEAAQTAYSNAYFSRSLDEGFCDYIRRTEAALKQVGLDPAMFRYKYGIKNWPTDTPEPERSRVVNWKFDDEYCYGR